ncbi:unnamed protein product, partial [Rotaria sordida]
LDNIDVHYSLLGLNNQPLDIIAQEQIFTNTLNFVSMSLLTNEISSISDSIKDRFCIDILPRIHNNVKSFIPESVYMERSHVWSETHESCGRYSQSPIIIKTACTVYRTFTPFDFSSAYNLQHDFTLLNTGHTVVGTYHGNDSSPFNLTGGGLNGTFRLHNFHLHWGENHRTGSEHQINDVKYPSEVHFVHINPQTKAVAVLGIFMNSTRHRNRTIYTRKRRDDIYNAENITITEWDNYFQAVANLTQKNNSVVLNLNLASLMGSNLDDFWRYGGSLTTPPCTEGITWTVFKTPVIFHERGIHALRNNIHTGNYRHPQPLFNRIHNAYHYTSYI